MIQENLHRLTAVIFRMGALLEDSEESRLRTTLHLRGSLLFSLAGLVWGIFYFVYGEYTASLIPSLYLTLTMVGLVHLAITGNYRFFRNSQFLLILLLPFFLQISLGGFISSSAVVVWSLLCPIGALMFAKREVALHFFITTPHQRNGQKTMKLAIRLVLKLLSDLHGLFSTFITIHSGIWQNTAGYLCSSLSQSSELQNRGGTMRIRLLSAALAFIFCVSTAAPACAGEDDPVLPSGSTYGEIEATVDAYVEAHADTTAALSVAVFTGKEVLLEKAYGYTDLENAAMNDLDSVHEWGSITKVLVWVSVMQLAEQGKIRLDEDIRAYLPDGFLTKLKYETPVTMLHLMNHNAGWQEVFTDIFIKDPKDVRDLEAALKLIEPEQVFEPGRVVAYSNWGAALAGYIVERVSGQAFDDYVHQHIFEPLGMSHTALHATLADNEWVAAQRARQKHYTADNQPLGTNLYFVSLYPAGMATGTLSDFIMFGQAFLPADGEKSPLFTERATLEEMLSPSLFFADGKTPRGRHGLWTDQLGVPVIWHNGGTKGSASWFAFDPVSGTGMITFTNQYEEVVYNWGLLPLIFGKYQNRAGELPAEDISGFYVPARITFTGFAKPAALFTLMELAEREEGGYFDAAQSFTMTPTSGSAFLLDQGGLKQFIIFNSTDDAGRKVLQLPGVDYLEVNGNGVMAQAGLLLLYLLAGIYALVALIISAFRKPSRSLGILAWSRTAVQISVIAAVGLSAYLTVTLFSVAPLLRQVRWSALLSGVLALVPVIYAAALVVKWNRLACTRREKWGLVLAGLAGLVMTANILFWESYKYW